jgi:hypothetical protein
MTQADGILHQFKMACNYSRHATKTRTVLLLDEVGLAEHSVSESELLVIGSSRV